MLCGKDPRKVSAVTIEKMIHQPLQDKDLFIDPEAWISMDSADSHFAAALEFRFTGVLEVVERLDIRIRVPGRFRRSKKVACIEKGRGWFSAPAFS